MATIIVTSLLDNEAADGLVTLREAILAANTDSSVDGSEAGSGADTIVFAIGLTGTIRLGDTDGIVGTAYDAGLGTFSVTEALTIDGDGRITITGDRAGDDTLQTGSTVLTNVTASLGNFNPTNLSPGGVGRLADNVRLISTSADLTLDGLTLTGGSTVDSGGAVDAPGAVTLTLTGATVSGNFAQEWGAALRH
jgi:hypothetical protein